jgi:hypothetical protein
MTAVACAEKRTPGDRLTTHRNPRAGTAGKNRTDQARAKRANRSEKTRPNLRRPARRSSKATWTRRKPDVATTLNETADQPERMKFVRLQSVELEYSAF